MKVLLVLCICILSIPLSAVAAEVTHEGTISRIFADDNGTVYLKLKGIVFGDCATVKVNHYYTLTDTHPRFDELYALALAAAHNQNQIRVRIDESTCDGTILENSPITRISQNF